MRNSILLRRVFSSLSSVWTCSTTLGLALTLLAALLFVGCQSEPHAHPPPRPAVPGSKSQETILPPRKTTSPAAWKAEADRWIGVRYRKGGLDRNGIDCSGLAARMYLAVTGIALPRYCPGAVEVWPLGLPHRSATWGPRLFRGAQRQAGGSRGHLLWRCQVRSRQSLERGGRLLLAAGLLCAALPPCPTNSPLSLDSASSFAKTCR